jgi:hypothetical protein
VYRSVSRIAVVVLSVASFAALARAADAPVPAREEVAQRAVEQAGKAAQPQEFTYGPILAKDSEVRGEIKKLYREQWDYDHATEAKVADLARQIAAEPDPDVRLALQREGVQLKQESEQKDLDFGLRIARLNGDQARVADFEAALDHLTHPEKYLPATRDPAVVAQERAHASAPAK